MSMYEVPGSKGRTLRRWRETGGKKDPPPLDDPVAMVPWFRRHHTKPVPQRLLKLAAEYAQKAEEGDAGEGEDEEVGKRAREPVEMPEVVSGEDASRIAAIKKAGAGMEPLEMLEDCRATVRYFQDLFDANKGKGGQLAEARADMANAALMRWVSILQKLEEMAVKVRKSDANFMPKADVQELVGKLFGQLNKRIVDGLVLRRIPKADAESVVDGVFAGVLAEGWLQA